MSAVEDWASTSIRQPDMHVLITHARLTVHTPGVSISYGG